MAAPRTLTVSVRELVEFACRTGDLGGRGEFTGASRALAGTRGHQRVQQARPEGYEKEVPLACVLEADGFTLEIKGRVDGRWRGACAPWLEEIKTIAGKWDGEADPLHWAQGKIYAAIWCAAEKIPSLEVRLTYLELDSGHVTTLRESFSDAQLAEFFARVTGEYVAWLGEQFCWAGTRDESIRALAFPFAEYRAGQREFAVAAYRTLARGGRLFAEAPTGIGKTISVIFPATKAMAEGHFSKLFYLTAKTSGRAVAEQAVADLRRGGLRLRAVTLTARDKICFGERKPCDAAECPFARGYYDRVKPALRDALGRESLTREVIEEVARRHEVCPFELSLDAATWCDAIIADYNYVFDPAVNLRRFFEDGPGDYAFLVDEAHNLVERGREMFSAELRAAPLAAVRRAITEELPACGRALGKIASFAKKFAAENPASRDLPQELPELLKKFLALAEAWLAQNRPAPFRDELLQLYFEAHRFVRTAEGFDENYVLLAGPGDDWRLRLFCLDPSKRLAEALARGRAAVMFSAPLSPLDFFRRLLGGGAGDGTLQLPSPFPPENFGVLIEDTVRTDFKSRAASAAAVAESIAAFLAARRGNYLVFFPSYSYLEAVRPLVEARLTGARFLVQRGGMSDAERASFLAEFDAEHDQTLAGFAVLGGAFGEGIDLTGERLIGAVLVGVGLPQVGPEREWMRQHFAERGEDGFAFAYRFPGVNRVVQAAGRVIRSETDRGAVLLIDARWREENYAALLPSWWRVRRVRGAAEIARAAENFWSGVPQRPE
ncbi:MAG: ATP-dependent DNA helicase [Verrucomicrobia bacterium]|nr:ATP-dependent DNA helicase [Verrucomicrobiota bacterium]